VRVWVIDTGAIVEIRRGLPTIVRGRVLRMLDARVNDGSLIFPPEVVDELQRMTDEISKKGVDLPYDWAKRHEEQATRFGRLFDGAKAVIKKCPSLVDHRKVSIHGVDDADPYVIALAIEVARQGHEVTIITEDVNTKPTKMALADAAGVFMVPAVRFRTFLMTEDIWDGVEGT